MCLWCRISTFCGHAPLILLCYYLPLTNPGSFRSAQTVFCSATNDVTKLQPTHIGNPVLTCFREKHTKQFRLRMMFTANLERLVCGLPFIGLRLTNSTGIFGFRHSVSHEYTIAFVLQRTEKNRVLSHICPCGQYKTCNHSSSRSKIGKNR